MSDLDVTAMLRSLGAGEAAGVPAWLETSWREPALFSRALYEYVGMTWPEPLKSRPQHGHDLYNDLVLRHLKQRRDAFVSYVPGVGWSRLSYEELHTRASALVPAWEAAGVKAGQTVAIVLPVSEEYVVALVTALRLGAVLSVLPPRGATFVRNRIEALAPDHVATLPRYASMLGEGAPPLLPLVPAEGSTPDSRMRSHTYAAQAPVARLFSPFSRTPEQPVEVGADTLGLGLLRDAVLVLGLRPDDRVTLPGFEPLQHQPHALLVTLLAGGCFLEVDEQALADASAAKQLAPTVVGMTPTLRDLLLGRQVSPTGWRLWLRNLAEPYDMERWEQLGAKLASVKRCRGMNLVLNAAFGGSLLFSPAQARPSHFAVLPTPGQPWQLSDLLGTGEPSHAESGLYAATHEGANEASFGSFLLSHHRTGYFFSGSIRPGAHGQTYPEAEVLQVVETHPDVLGASVVLTTASPELHRTRVSLLVFTHPAQDTSRLAAVLRPELEERIDLELGARYRPDALCFYPLVPRRTDKGDIDHAWCRWQFLSGGLDRKAKDELFRMLGHLRLLLAQETP